MVLQVAEYFAHFSCCIILQWIAFGWCSFCTNHFSELHSFTSALWLIMLMWNDFFLDAATNLKEKEIFVIEPVSTPLKLVCNLKHLSCN